MPDNASMIPADDSAVIHEISLYVYQAIIEIQQHQPELLREKYRNVPWRDGRNQSIFMIKLKEEFSKIQDQEALIQKIQTVLKLLLIPKYFELSSFQELMERIQVSIQQLLNYRQLTAIKNSPLVVTSTSPKSEELEKLSSGIAILLLDVENLQLNPDTEKFLTTICNYPIQIKIAFANWSKMGKQDIEFHKRGYELIHVPSGKDSADVKMATVGSSIFVHYPRAKEILVCSSDRVLTHLCTTLQTHGLTVYLVRKQGDTITILNSMNSHTHTYSLTSLPAIPSLEQVLIQLKELMKGEQLRTNNQWIKLSRLSSLFKEKYQINLSQVVSHHFPGKRARDIFFNHPADFAVHQLSEKSELLISLFEMPIGEITPINNSNQKPSKTNKIVQFSSKDELEQALIKIINADTAQFSENNYMPITILGTLFQRQYGQPVNAAIKKLQLPGNFIKFLQSCSIFELKQTDKGWEVKLRVVT